MEKILLPLDGRHLDLNILRFACYIAEITRSTLTGAFVEDLYIYNVPALDQLEPVTFEEKREFNRFQQSQDVLDPATDGIQLFKEACKKTGVRCEVFQFTLQQIINESRFSDLIILDPRINGDFMLDGAPSGFVKDLLGSTECPVIVAPENYHEIQEIIHTYDGSRSSVFSIKQFTYLFPELTSLKCTLLKVNKNDEWTIEKEDEMKQWLKSHYSQCGFEVLHGKVEDELERYLEDDSKKYAFVTMGAYGRNTFSNLIRESKANVLIRNMRLPVFISHQ